MKEVSAVDSSDFGWTRVEINVVSSKDVKQKDVELPALLLSQSMQQGRNAR